MMNRVILFFALCLFSTSVFAKPQDLSWSWPTLDCDSDPLNQADWFSAEIIYDTAPMPMPSDTSGPCTTQSDPDGPPTSTSVPITSPVTTTTLNLQPGIPYYARIRVCYVSDGYCSNWSTETSFIVPYGKPGQPIWIN